MNVDIIKALSGMVVSAGVGTIVKNAVKATTPDDLKRHQKLFVTVGGLALAGMVGNSTVKYVEGQIDSLNKSIEVGYALGESLRKAKLEKQNDASANWGNFDIIELSEFHGQEDRPIVTRKVKFGEDIQVPMGTITMYRGPSGTGKSYAAEEWRKQDPENRRVIDGSWDEKVTALINEGYDVVLTTNLTGE